MTGPEFVVTSYIVVLVRREKWGHCDIYQAFFVEVHTYSLDKCLIFANKRFQTLNIKIISTDFPYYIKRSGPYIFYNFHSHYPLPRYILPKKQMVVDVVEPSHFEARKNPRCWSLDWGSDLLFQLAGLMMYGSYYAFRDQALEYIKYGCSLHFTIAPVRIAKLTIYTLILNMPFQTHGRLIEYHSIHNLLDFCNITAPQLDWRVSTLKTKWLQISLLSQYRKAVELWCQLSIFILQTSRWANRLEVNNFMVIGVKSGISRPIAPSSDFL